MANSSRPPALAQSLSVPGQQRRVFSQQLLQAFDIVVVNDASSLCCRPLESFAEAFADFSGEVLPAGVAVLTGDHELRIALRQRHVDMWQVRARTCDGTRRHRRRCRARASLPASGGIPETDEPAGTSTGSLRPPFMNRLCPAETRLKEGADAHDFGPNRWECSLAAGGWRPVSALPPVSRDCRVDVKSAAVGLRSRS